MDDLAANVDGSAEGLKGDLDDIDGAHHTGAKAARLQQQYSLLLGGSPGLATVRRGFEDSCGHSASISTGQIFGGRFAGRTVARSEHVLDFASW